ncbi:MAG TPA: DUF2190 family protein [Phycisphaerae bacterium]|nr:DUF2190 family protein [Phycisphaerae bacterium]HPP28908.1 DUF2190 family protein [Phycisphaerae bacterium]
MTASFVHEGASIDYTPATDLAAGEVVSIVTPDGSGFIGVAPRPVPAGVKGALAVEGVFQLPKAAEDLVAGQKVYWDALQQKIVASPTLLGCAGNPVVNGRFLAGNANWTNWTERGSASRDFNSPLVPAGGKAPGLRIWQTGNFNGGVYQAVTLTPGRAYTLRVLCRDLASTVDAAWAEVLIGTPVPVNGQDYAGGSGGRLLLAKWDTYVGARWNGDQASASVAQSLTFTATAATMYLVLKVGQNTSPTAVVDVSFDDVALCESPGSPAVRTPIGMVIADAPSAETTVLVRLRWF